MGRGMMRGWGDDNDALLRLMHPMLGVGGWNCGFFDTFNVGVQRSQRARFQIRWSVVDRGCVGYEWIGCRI